MIISVFIVEKNILRRFLNLKCSEHERNGTYEPQNIQECCRNCLEILYFKQIPVEFFIDTSEFHDSYTDIYHNLYKNAIESEKNCKLCGKSLYQGKDIDKIKLCSNCYLISFGCVKSTLTEKSIPIIYLPWWHNIYHCEACGISLTFTSDYQKYCTNCLIFYTGCRYCLTTNVIFGPTIQSQCKKCKRVSSINFDITKISIGNSYLDDFLSSSRLNIYNYLKITEFVDKVKGIEKYFFPYTICKFIYQDVKLSMEWIPYSQFTNINEIAKGGFGIIYKANWLDDPKLEDYILVMEYAKEGDLHNLLQKRFADITWNKEKLIVLWQISEGLETIHKANYIHRDFHSGNILFGFSAFKYNARHQLKIGDLGLSQPANNTSSKNEIYGVIPYIAPEIFKGSSFSKETDVYCMGMIMWELTTGCKPFANVEHDIQLIYKILDGERPVITEDMPECYANLMKSCWDPDHKKRPSIKKVRNTLGSWYFRNKHIEAFNQAESKRIELINSGKLGPEFSEKSHPSAIFTSRPLSSLISKCSAINSSKDYTSIELELDIDIERSNVFETIEELNINSHVIDYISKELELDIDIERSNVLGIKRNIEELNINSHENNGKRIKIEQ
ncbi:unnamed protein product [Rhizophagus irregularis]|nr:unnamed protein product [Rhizophagus irregularis]